MLTQTIQDIKDRVSKIDDWLKKTPVREINAKLGVGTRFGFEGELSTREFKASIKELVRDIRMCIKAHAQFVCLSTRDERVKLKDELELLANSLEAEDYLTAVAKFELIKPMLRAFRVRGTTEARNDLEQQINEAHRLVSLLQADLEEIEICKGNAKEFEKHISELAQQTEANKGQLQEQQTMAQEIQGQLQERVQKVEEFVANIRDRGEIINNFFQKIEAREQQLQQQQVATQTYEEKLQTYSEEVADLIESSKQALEYTTAVGVSAAFTERYIEYKKRRSWLWVIGAGILISAVPVLAVFWWYTAKELDFVSLVYRFAVVSVVFSGAYFCAAQYKKQRSVQEDYGYKAVLAKSLVGFLEKLPEDAKEVYLARVLSEIHKDPMRKMHEVDDTASESFLSKLSGLKRRGEE